MARSTSSWRRSLPAASSAGGRKRWKMWNRRTILLSAVAVACFAMALPARAADPTGIWLTEDDEARVRIYRCDQDLCGTVLSLKEPNEPATGKLKLDKFNQDKSKRTR